MTTNQQEYNPVEQYPQRFRMLGLAPFLHQLQNLKFNLRQTSDH